MRIFVVNRSLFRSLKVLLVLVLLQGIISSRSYGQQEVVFHQYMNGMQFFNPAYTGLPGCMELSYLYRSQWSDFENNPTTNTVMFGTPVLNYNIGVGLSIFHDQFGPIKETGLFADYSYRIKLTADNLYLSFGLKGGVTIYNSNLTDLDIIDPTDPMFSSDINNKILPNFGAGVLLHKDNYFIGISSPRILQNSITVGDNVETSYREELYLFTTAGYVFDLNKFIKLKPSFIFRYESSSPISFDLSAQLYMYDRLSLGLLYRIGDAYGIMASYNVTEQLSLGYAYDYTALEKTDYTSGAHEVSLRYRFNFTRNRSYIHPVYY